MITGKVKSLISFETTSNGRTTTSIKLIRKVLTPAFPVLHFLFICIEDTAPPECLVSAKRKKETATKAVPNNANITKDDDILSIV